MGLHECHIAPAFSMAACDPPGKPKPEPPSSQEITDFATLYGENCEACHGPNGKNGPGRPLNDALYLAIFPRDVLQKTIENGRPGTAMPAWARSQGGPLTDEQIEALVSGIDQNWANPARFRSVALPSYSPGDNPGDPKQGKKLFARDCFMCHGPKAPIGSVTDPAFLQLVSDQVYERHYSRAPGSRQCPITESSMRDALLGIRM